jgi:hypothetical protein
MKKKSLLMTAVATLGLTAATMAQSVPSYVPTNGLVGWWPFNGNANDESGNGNNGTVNGATLTVDRFGNANKAYSFNGVSNEIVVPHDVTLNSLPISISLWFRTSISQANKMLVNKFVCQSQNGYSFRLNNNKPSAFYFSNGQSNNYLSLDAVSTNFQSLNDDIWHNGILIVESDSSKLYIDGNLIHSDAVIGSLTVTNTNTDLRFGNYPQGVCTGPQNFYYSGLIDDIGIWNRALSQQEISDLYNGNICYQNITVTDTLLINMGITGFNPVTYNNTIKIFPNPTNDHITIDYGNFASLSGYQLKIINSLSQIVFQTNITQQSDYLNLTTWGGNGLYFVQIIDTQGNISDIRKIVIQ